MSKCAFAGLLTVALSAAATLWHFHQGANVQFISASVQSSAGFVLEPEHRELGTMIPGQDVQITFSMRNDAPDTIVISDLHTSCGCSPATISTQVLARGEASVVTVNLKVPQPGAFSHAVLFKTNYPGREDVRLTFAGRAVWPIICDPAVLSLGVIDLGGTTGRDIELTSSDNSPFRIMTITAGAQWLTVSDPSRDCRPQHRLRAAAGMVPGPGRAQTDIEVYTDHPKQSVVRIPVTADVVAPLTPFPSRLLLPNAKAGQVVVGRILLSRRARATAEITRLTVDDATWEVVRWSTSGATTATNRPVEVELRVPSNSGYHRATLQLTPQMGEVITVPVSVLVGN